MANDNQTLFVDKFEDDSCRAGGNHQWLGDGLVHFSNGKSMNARQFSLLSKRMQQDYTIVGQESTCNKCGAAYTQAFNPFFL